MGHRDRTILLLPGFLTRGQVLFKRHLDTFSRFGDVDLVEYPAHGDPYAGELLRRLAARIRGRQGRRVTVVGASFGAQVGINLLRQLGAGQSAVDTYVSVCGPTDAADVRPPIAVLGRLRPVSIALAPMRKTLLAKMMPPVPPESWGPGARAGDIEERREDTFRTPTSAVTARLRAMRIQPPLRDNEFPNVRAVSLYARDDADPYVHGRAEEKIARAFPLSRRGHRLPAGHINFLEHPGAYEAAMCDALEQTGPDPITCDAGVRRRNGDAR